MVLSPLSHPLLLTTHSRPPPLLALLLLQVIAAHPPVLSYSVAERLEPFWSYMVEIVVTDVAAAVIGRPSLLGLDVDANLRKVGGCVWVKGGFVG